MTNTQVTMVILIGGIALWMVIRLRQRFNKHMEQYHPNETQSIDDTIQQYMEIKNREDERYNKV